MRELETGFHNLKEVRQQRIRRLNDIVDEYLVGTACATDLLPSRSTRLAT
jgi:hypothetical protein